MILSLLLLLLILLHFILIYSMQMVEEMSSIIKVVIIHVLLIFKILKSLHSQRMLNPIFELKIYRINLKLSKIKKNQFITCTRPKTAIKSIIGTIETWLRSLQKIATWMPTRAHLLTQLKTLITKIIRPYHRPLIYPLDVNNNILFNILIYMYIT